MDRLTRWETEALRSRGGRPRPRSRTIDLRDSVRAGDPEPRPVEEPPPGTLLVPLDAWQRMLDQLGNLHEAGQQLADASARAAKAETEAAFLRERVADLRRQLAEAEAADALEDDASSDVDEKKPTVMSVAMRRGRRAWHDLRSRLSR